MEPAVRSSVITASSFFLKMKVMHVKMFGCFSSFTFSKAKVTLSLSSVKID